MHALDSVPTRPGVSIHSGTQLQNYKELEVKWGYESEVHKNRTFDDLRSRPSAARRHMLFGHGSLPLGFTSLCAHLAAFHFKIEEHK